MNAFRGRMEEAYGRCRPLAFALSARALLARTQLESGSPVRLYVVYDETADAFKIGTAGQPKKRLSELQVGTTNQLLLVAHCPGTVKLERFFHSYLDRDRISGEWFRSTDRTLTACVQIVAMSEICDDMRETDCGGDHPGDAVAALVSQAEEFLLRVAEAA